MAMFDGLRPKDFVVYNDENELDNLIRGKKYQVEIKILRFYITIILINFQYMVYI